MEYIAGILGGAVKGIFSAGVVVTLIVIAAISFVAYMLYKVSKK